MASRSKGVTRRQALQSGGFLAASHAVHVASAQSPTGQSSNDRPRIGVIGCGSRWGWQLANGGRYGVGPDFARFAAYVAASDVDATRLSAAGDLIKRWCGEKPELSVDYQDVLQREDIDAVLIFTPDHWHSKIAIEAMKAGKDVYCEKPLTLTIDEGRQICRVCQETRRVFQVGTQQRSNRGFLTALALINEGRLGRLTRVECGIGEAPTSPMIPASNSPASLDWDRWLGPVEHMDYRFLSGAKNETSAWTNNHYEFRWWYQFSGGKLTDWGAHHVDIATLGIGLNSGRTRNEEPRSVHPRNVVHPVEFRDGKPLDDDRYNTATQFDFEVKFDSGVDLSLRSDSRNGVLFQGEKGRIFVNRGGVTGRPVEELKMRPLPDGALEAVAKQRPVLDRAERFDSLGHVQDFFRCMESREEPISDVFNHQRAITTCHLAGISARLYRGVDWDSKTGEIVDDPQANSMLSRVARAGYEVL